jgi:hypothetical protein
MNTSALLLGDAVGGTPITCNAVECSPINNICCGLDEADGKYYCASSCSCPNTTSCGPCCCNPGFIGPDCSQLVSPTVWLAVILTVGTLLVLFIAWGFRCSDGTDTTMDSEVHEHHRTVRNPLLREGGDVAAGAASSRGAGEASTMRGDTENPSTMDYSLTGPGTSDAGNSLPRRTCCVCLAKPLQVVLIPCGHACVCRRCSRKLDKCPLCRLDIQATQRIYF